jgi:phosphodiesterase/alkaline phosphatase D-like protein
MSKIDRRDFIRLFALGIGSAILAACQAKGLVTPTSAKTSSLAPTAIASVTKKPKGQTGVIAPLYGNPDFIATEILGRPTDSSVTASIVPAVAMSIFYEYGTAPGQYTNSTPQQTASVNVPLETLISGLQPNTRYYYRLHYNDTPGAEHSFVTQRTPGTTFTFHIQGDSHPERINKQFSPDLYPITLLRAAADQPDFYLTIGDDFSVDTLKTVNADTVKALYMNQRQWLGQVGVPVFLVNGNHEQASMANLDGTPYNVAVWAQTARNAYYPQPAPDNFYSGDMEPVEFIGQLRDYYAFTWGDALFVVIDPYWHSPATVDNLFGVDRDQKAKRDLWQVSIGDAQYQWFKRTLETSAAKFKFVFSHHVLGTQRGGIEVANQYEWGDAKNLSSHRPGWDKTIHQLMVDNHVTIYFQGHDHIFVRQELDGVIYQSLPQPADPNYALNNAVSYKSGDKLPSTGYLRVTVSLMQVLVDYIRTFLPQDEKDGHKSGEVAYTYTVQG